MPSGNPIWTDPQAFSKAVDEYFETESIPTWTGLAIHLGFESRQSLWEYGKKESFALPVKKALLRIENVYEQNLNGKNPAGAIFALKNFNWKDRQEIELDVNAERKKVTELFSCEAPDTKTGDKE